MKAAKSGVGGVAQTAVVGHAVPVVAIGSDAEVVKATVRERAAKGRGVAVGADQGVSFGAAP